MQALATFKWQDESDNVDLQARGDELVDSLFPHLGSDSWDPVDASYAGLFGQAFLALEGNVKELQDGNVEDDSAIKKSAEECVQALQAPWATQHQSDHNPVCFQVASICICDI